MKGLVLAGGKSTRVPYKLFLSEKGTGRPIFESSVRLLRLLGVEPIIVSNLSLKTSIESFGTNGRTFVYDDYKGILGILREYLSEDDLIVCCGDNLYGESTHRIIDEVLRLSTSGVKGYACVTSQFDEELDGWDRNKRWWLNRGYTLPSVDACLSSPWILPKSRTNCNSLIGLLNRLAVEPIYPNDNDWYDLGTERSLQRYYSKGTNDEDDDAKNRSDGGC